MNAIIKLKIDFRTLMDNKRGGGEPTGRRQGRTLDTIGEFYLFSPLKDGYVNIQVRYELADLQDEQDKV